jgi:hypothetical protein
MRATINERSSMEQPEQDQSRDEVQTPDDAVEDLEPSDEESQDVSGGKYSDIVLKKGMTSN